jgi:plasmid stabilization system protein ParE
MTEVLEYIEARSPSGAENVKRRLKGIIDLLADHPNSGRTINKGNLRRFVVIPYPYVIFYRADPTGIVIHAFAMLPAVPFELHQAVRLVDSSYVII